MSIRRLPQDAVDKIRSSSAVTCLNDVVCGLLKNSLDAGSSKINIQLDFFLGSCTVEDNGAGIKPSEFNPEGGLAKLHHTSRIPQSSSIHGRHGDFLASVAALSLLTIASHHRCHDSLGYLSLHNGRVLARNIPALHGQRLESFSHGTRITIRNLFGAMPVRVKHRGHQFSDRGRVDKEWETLSKEIVSLLLPWPSEVSISLRELNTQKEARFKSSNTDIVTRTERLYTQAGLASSQNAGSWVPVSLSSRRVRVKGAISKNPAATRRSQIMSLGIQPIPNSFGTNVLYEEVNKIFKHSTFGTAQDDMDDQRSKDTKWKARKNIERWPMFYFEISLAAGEGSAMNSLLGDSPQCLEVIIDLLKVACYAFLKKHCLQPRHIQSMHCNQIRSIPSKSLPHSKVAFGQSFATGPGQPRAHLPHTASQDIKNSRAYSPFDEWSHVKVGWAATRVAKSGCAQENVALAARPETRPLSTLIGANGVFLRKPIDDVNEISDAVNPGKSKDGSLEVLLPAPNTNTTKTMVEKDNMLRLEPSAGREQELCSSQQLETRPQPQPQPQEWLQEVLRSWRNPVFEPTELQIPALHQNSAEVDRPIDGRRDGPTSKFYTPGNDVQFEAVSIRLDGRLSRSALSSAEVIGQVDRKFLLLRLPLHDGAKQLSESSALVMLDQHAADERCRLEDLMSQYFEINLTGILQAVTEILDPPIVFEVSSREQELLRRLHTHFLAWGIIYSNAAERLGPLELEVTALPPSILERCRIEPRLLIDVLRKELWKYEDGNCPPRPVHESGRPMVSRFHTCPQGILELLHSRSCRSAIMFNDELTIDECQQLVFRLSNCTFPFQCAHGRPSLVPLVDIGPGSGRVGVCLEKSESPGIGQWKSWLSKGS